MIAVERTVRSAEPAAAERLLEAMDAAPGAWLGCDVAAEGLFERRAYACVDPPLSFYLDGATLRIVARTALGRALAEIARPLAAFVEREGRLEAELVDAAARPHPVVTLLRRFLASFAPASPELALYGALAFDFHRLERGDTVPADGRRRLALHFPDRVLALDGDAARWIEFRFDGLPAPRLAERASDAPAARIERTDDDLPPGGHAANVARGVERLRRGDLYSLVLSQTFRRRVRARPSTAFGLLRARNPYPAMFALNLGGGEAVFGASPDIQVRADGEWIEATPVCGTFRRGGDAIEDHEQARALVNSAVDEASLAVCTDSDRNDKALVCVPGTVEVRARRRVHFFSTIVHTIDAIRGRRKSGVDGFDIVLAHATPPTVTGFPKPLARAVVESIEGSWRGWYAGAAVRIAADGSCEALTMLRFARIVGEIAEVRSGGSLLADSDPEREEAETRLKAETIFRVLEGASPAPPVVEQRIAAAGEVELVATDDPFAPTLAETLVRAGARPDGSSMARLRVVSATTHAPDRRPTLYVGNAAFEALRAQGAPVAPLAVPRFGRALACRATPDGPLAERATFQLAQYASATVPSGALPPDWQVFASTPEGDLIAAGSRSRRAVVLLARPDGVLATRANAGPWVIGRLLAWLHDLSDNDQERT
jgi:anthranilate/para-aminobenzoate synthase component I